MYKKGGETELNYVGWDENVVLWNMIDTIDDQEHGEQDLWKDTIVYAV